MKSTELLSILFLIGCTDARRHYPGVTFMQDEQREGASIESLAEAEADTERLSLEQETSRTSKTGEPIRCKHSN